MNLSLTGLAVSSPIPVPVGQNRIITLTSEEGTKVDLESVSRRCILTSAQPTLYEIGFDFTQDLGGKAPQILKFLEAHIVVDLDRRLSGRFQLEQGDFAEMRSSVDFEVRRLSRTGMLVETSLLVFSGEENVFELLIDSEALPLKAQGRVAYVDRNPDLDSGGLTRIGIEFMELDEDQVEALHAYIRDLID